MKKQDSKSMITLDPIFKKDDPYLPNFEDGLEVHEKFEYAFKLLKAHGYKLHRKIEDFKKIKKKRIYIENYMIRIVLTEDCLTTRMQKDDEMEEFYLEDDYWFCESGNDY